jgi:hypothetical protein
LILKWVMLPLMSTSCDKAGDVSGDDLVKEEAQMRT